MTRLPIAIALALLVVAPVSALRGQDRGREVLEGAAARYADVETLCARFRQTLEVPLLGEQTTGSGRVCQSRPNLFAMRFTDPEGDAIVGDGESVWVFTPSLDPRQVIRTSADRTAGGHDFHREFLVDAERKYVVTYEAREAVEGRETHRLRLVPRGPASYRAAVVWIDDGEPVLRRVRVEEENGNVRTITLSEVEFDAAPGADWFSFTPPEGAMVLVG